jgi:SAM-dependent methyltransferase
MLSLNIDYKSQSCELCEIGKKYDTDKSSQRNNVVPPGRHCHPYTLFYDNLFKTKRECTFKMAELGILDGASLRMWQEYFPNATINGFEYNMNFVDQFKNLYDNDRISLYYTNVFNKESIETSFLEANCTYDIIIEDTTHQFEDQIRVIEVAYQYLNPGGILIIEDIFKSYKEEDYLNRLQHILPYFQDYYFVSPDHTNRNSIGWDNDKLLIMIRSGAEPIFKSDYKLTIITPSYRVENLEKVKQSINFDYVDEWIIVYDGNRIDENPNMFKEEEKIKEYIIKDENGSSGNPQRNYALSTITKTNTLLFYLDDDNVMHPDLFRVLNFIDKNKMYTFNQTNRLIGNRIAVNSIDTAMVMIDYSLCKEIRWDLGSGSEKDGADGIYIMECYNNNKDKYIFINNDLCYYNFINNITQKY